MRKTTLVSALAIAGLLTWAPTAGACVGAKVPAGGESADLARQAMTCLINGLRQRRHLHQVSANVSLGTAAQQHSNDMNAENFFSHGGDGTLASRAAGAGFQGKALGETLAYGGGVLGSPKRMVRDWMHSPEHRRILLMRGWRQIGVGVSFGSPLGADAPGEATYTADFGH
jgi:uncharacterized protein YkwD